MQPSLSAPILPGMPHSYQNQQHMIRQTFQQQTINQHTIQQQTIHIQRQMQVPFFANNQQPGQYPRCRPSLEQHTRNSSMHQQQGNAARFAARNKQQRLRFSQQDMQILFVPSDS